MTKAFYDKYHKANHNVKIQKKLIREPNYTYQSLLRIIKKKDFSEKNILDYGCGVGTIDLFLASRTKKVIGIDISKNAVELARESSKQLNINNIEFLLGDESLLKSIEEKFDIVICSEVVEHVKNDKLLLYLLSNVLKPGGLLILSTPLLNAPLYRIGYLNNFDKEVGHLRRYNLVTLQELIENCGMEINEYFYTEGPIRNFLYTSKHFGFLIRFIRGSFIINFVNILDSIMGKIFGFSNIYIIANKK